MNAKNSSNKSDLKKQAWDEINSCCTSFCNKNKVIEYIKYLENLQKEK